MKAARMAFIRLLGKIEAHLRTQKEAAATPAKDGLAP